jgi:hypothetical protein
MRNKMMIGALSALAAFALACGAGAEVTSGDTEAGEVGVTEKKAAAPKAVKAGQKLVVTTSALAATYTLSKVEQRTSDQYDMEPQNGVFVLAFLRVDVSKGEMFACSCELSLVQADGKVRESAYASFRSRPEFESAELKAGQHADGWVMWDMPKSEVKGAKVQLKVASLLSDSEYGYWSLA